MTENRNPAAKEAGVPARTSENDRDARRAALVDCTTALEEGQVAVFREVFPDLFEAHYDKVWAQCRRRVNDDAEAADIVQEVFAAFFDEVVEEGFKGRIPGMLWRIADGKLANWARGVRRAPISVGLPSSRSEPPLSSPDVDRAIDLEQVRALLPRLPAEQRTAVEMVVIAEMTHEEAARALDIPLGTLKSRVSYARSTLRALIEELLPPSQRKA
jgi:RNA polymerase sigma-70 factor (ECF subfamily)